MPKDKKKITLALQGGAAYGAFTWGVIDRLLQDDRIEITGVSGASAGALNAVALAHGMDKNGSDGARDTLKSMWENLTYDTAIQQMPILGKASSKANSKLRSAFETLSKYDNSGIIKSLQAANQGAMMSIMNKSEGLFEKTIEESVDFKALKTQKTGIPVFVSATDINAHKARTFDRSDLTATAVKASCAIPVVVGSVEIDGRHYWDGGFTENPCINPLKECDGNDIMIIQTIPFLERDGDEKPKKIMDRILELRTNASVRKDLEYIQKDNERFRKNPKAAAELNIKKINTHLINIDKAMKAGHMLSFDRRHVEELHDLGIKAAEQWLNDNFDSLGKKSTFTINNHTSKTPKPKTSNTPKK